MSSGTYTNVIDSYNSSTRVWSGASTPKGTKVYPDLPYSLDHTVKLRLGEDLWNFATQAYSYAYFSWVSTPGVGVSAGDKTKLNAKNKADLVNKIRGSFNAGVAAAELPDALDSIVKSCRAIYQAHSAVASGRFGDAARILLRAVAGTDKHKWSKKDRTKPEISYYRKGKLHRQYVQFRERPASLNRHDVGDTWLALQWGWLPLLSDIYAAVEAVEEWNKTRSLTYRKTSVITQFVPMQVGVNWAFLYGKMQSSYSYVQLPYERSLRISRKWVLAEDPSKVFQLGLTDPLSIIWEKTPFSCVIDYLYPIGDALTAASAYWLTLATWSYSELEVVYGKTKDVFPPLPLPKAQTMLVHTNMLSRIKYVRQVGSNYEPLSVTGTKVPRQSVEKAFSLSHLANVGALLNGFAKRKP